MELMRNKRFELFCSMYALHKNPAIRMSIDNVANSLKSSKEKGVEYYIAKTESEYIEKYLLNNSINPKDFMEFFNFLVKECPFILKKKTIRKTPKAKINGEEKIKRALLYEEKYQEAKEIMDVMVAKRKELLKLLDKERYTIQIIWVKK